LNINEENSTKVKKWIDLCEMLKQHKSNSTIQDKKIKILENLLNVYRVEADKTLSERSDINVNDVKNLIKFDDEDEGDVHKECKRLIKILKTQNLILEKRDKKHQIRREELIKENLSLEEKYIILQHVHKRLEKET